MELRRNSCVLPSNAPVLGRLDSSKRVFQVTSGNLQSSAVDNVDTPTKVPYDGQVTSESLPPSTDLAPSAERLDHRKRKRVRRLPILSRDELNSPKYLAYRARQRRNTGKDGEPVWPDDLEEAFQRALRAIPPFGRKKKTLAGRASGRNELITHSILQWTGKERTRKQVSSHIQVLKKYMLDNTSWMKLVTADPASDQFDTQTQNEYYDSTAGRLVTADSRSQFGRGCDSLGALQDSYSDGLPPPAGTLGSNAPIHGPSIQGINFEMWVNPPTDENQMRSPLHIYTSIQSDTSISSMVLEDVRHWRSTYPHLSTLHQDGQLDGTQLILLEANFDLMDAFPPRGSKLGIRLGADIAFARGYHSFRYVSNFYQAGTSDPMHSCGDGLKYTHIPGNDTVRLEIPLESKWWVMLFHKITERRFAEEATGDTQAVQADAEQTRQYLREMTIMQEISATPNGGSSPQRVAILLWKFRQTRPGETAITTWRKLHAPPSRIMTNSPTPPFPQPPMIIDGAIHDNITPQATPLYAEFFNHQAELMADPDLPGSTSPTLSMQYLSLNSSLPSTSLPSNYNPIPHDSTYPSTTASMTPYQQHSGPTDPNANDFTGGQIQIQFQDPPPPPYHDHPLSYPPSQPSLQRQHQHQHQHQHHQQQQYEANNQWAAAYHASMFAGVEFQHQGYENMDLMARQGSAPGQVLGNAMDLDGGADLGFQ